MTEEEYKIIDDIAQSLTNKPFYLLSAESKDYLISKATAIYNEDWWKRQTCEKCKFRDGAMCRKFPPEYYYRQITLSPYPSHESVKTIFQIACSYYEESKWKYPLH